MQSCQHHREDLRPCPDDPCPKSQCPSAHEPHLHIGKTLVYFMLLLYYLPTYLFFQSLFECSFQNQNSGCQTQCALYLHLGKAISIYLFLVVKLFIHLPVLWRSSLGSIIRSILVETKLSAGPPSTLRSALPQPDFKCFLSNFFLKYILRQVGQG